MPSQTILFDLEGTVVQVKVDQSKVVEFLIGRLRASNPGENFQGAPTVAETLRQAEGKVASAALEEIRKSASSKLVEAEKAAAASATERKDAIKAISELQSMGTKAAAITGLSEEGAKEVLRRMNLEGTVSIAASRDDSTDPKERLAIAVKESGSKPEDVILIGHSPRAVEAARSSGVRCFIVYSQEVPISQVIGSKPDALLFSIAELGDTMRLLAQKSRVQQVIAAAEAGAPQSGEPPDADQTTEPGPETTGGR